MKKLILGCVLAMCAVSTGQGQRQQAARVVSPEVLADHRVTFRLQAPQAREVILTGEFLDGRKNLEQGADGVWTVTVGPIDPETYHYNFTIDGVRTIDPLNPNLKTGSTASTISSVLDIPGDATTFYRGQNVPHGDVHTHWYQSKSLNSLRRLTVYTPPGYDASTARLPVLYLFHGANADESAWIRLGRANLILDNLMAAGKIKPFIVVMPFGYGVDPNGGPQGENTARFARDLIEDVIPYTQERYRTSTDRTQRAIVGLSMGGGEALTIGLNHLDLFSYVGGFSAAIGQSAGFSKTFAGLVGDPDANKKLRLLWVGCGTEDSLFAPNKSFSDFLTANKVKHTFKQSGGAHTWMVWRRYLSEVSPLLFQ
jgi:enterochelin esterase family protein